MPRRKETRFKNFCMRGRYWLADDLVEGRRIFSFGRRLSLVESNINNNSGNSPAVQWLRLHASPAGSMDSIPGWGTKISHATWHGQKGKKQYTNTTTCSSLVFALRLQSVCWSPWALILLGAHQGTACCSSLVSWSIFKANSYNSLKSSRVDLGTVLKRLIWASSFNGIAERILFIEKNKCVGIPWWSGG